MAEIKDHKEQLPETAEGSIELTGIERRRPGRRTQVDPALVPLLRRTPDLDAMLPEFDLEKERLADRAPSRGILVGIAVSALFWAAGIAAIRAVFF